MMPLIEIGKAQSGMGIKCQPGERSGWFHRHSETQYKGFLNSRLGTHIHPALFSVIPCSPFKLEQTKGIRGEIYSK